MPIERSEYFCTASKITIILFPEGFSDIYLRISSGIFYFVFKYIYQCNVFIFLACVRKFSFEVLYLVRCLVPDLPPL